MCQDRAHPGTPHSRYYRLPFLFAIDVKFPLVGAPLFETMARDAATPHPTLGTVLFFAAPTAGGMKKKGACIIYLVSIPIVHL